MVDLPRRHIRILFSWIEVEARSSIVIVAEDYLLSRLVFRADVVEGEVVCAVFSPP